MEFDYLFEQIVQIGSHNSLFDCGVKHLSIDKEKRHGLHSKFELVCNMCGEKFELQTARHDDFKMDINQDIVSGIMSTGAGYTQLNTVLAHADIPPMSLRLYQATHDQVSQWWEQTADHCMAEAGKEEVEHAKLIGNMSSQGIPMIAVIADACWSKRSYGTNYDASSGAAAIVGQHSKKVLYCGVKNKYCVICSRSINKGMEAPAHTCFKNFSGPSTAMEAAIITEGFKSSLTDHGLIYSHLIADGDANTYACIRNARPYENVTVGKIECKNHLLRNYCKALLAVSTNSSYHIKARKLVKANYLRLRFGVDSSIKHWSKQNIPFSEKVDNIKKDIENGPHHVFGDHSYCAPYFCNKTNSENFVPELVAFGVFQKLTDLAYRLSQQAYSFAYNETNNLVESFNARVAKYVGGKRVNYSLKGSYGGRCAAAVISFNTDGTLQSFVHKFIFGTEANAKIIQLENKRKENNYRKRDIKKKKTLKHFPTKNAHYGIHCQKPDMDTITFDERKNKFLKDLALSKEDRHILERSTVLQSASSKWLETRRKLLTASWFSRVCKRRAKTNCRSLVRQILYGNDLGNVPSIKHGRQNEHTALRELEQELNVIIEECGLFIDNEFSFLGATPDGKCNIGIVEVKCPSSAYNLDPEEAVKQKKIDFWVYRSNAFIVNKKSKWYYQVQGQLRVTGQDMCVFAVWTGVGKLKYEFVKRDDQFWKENMEGHLVKFYYNCLLPELVDPRYPRSMDLRDHSSHTRKNVLSVKNNA